MKRSYIKRLCENPIYASILEDPANVEARLVLADALEEQGDPLGNFIRAQFGLSSGRLSKIERQIASRTRWEYLRDVASQFFAKEIDLVWDWPWPSDPHTFPGDRTLRPSFAKSLKAKSLWQFQHGLPDTLAISGKRFVKDFEPSLLRYPVQHLALFDVTSEAMLAARKNRRVVYPTKKRWGRLEHVLEASQLSQIRSLAITDAHLEIDDIDRIVNSSLHNLESLTIMVAPIAFREAIKKIAKSKTMRNLRNLDVTYKPHHEQDSLSHEINDEVLQLLATSPEMENLERIKLLGESMRMHDPISLAGIKALMDANRFKKISLVSSELNDEVLDLISQHPNANKLEELKLGWGVFSTEALERMARYDNWENLKIFEMQHFRSMAKFDLLPFAESGHFPNLQRMFVNSKPLLQETVRAMAEGLPSLREFYPESPISIDTEPEVLEEFLAKLDYLYLQFDSAEVGELFDKANLFEHVTNLELIQSANNGSFQGLVANQKTSSVQYLEIQEKNFQDENKNWQMFKMTEAFAEQLIESPFGQNLIVYNNSGHRYETPVLWERFGRCFFSENENRSEKRS